MIDERIAAIDASIYRVVAKVVIVRDRKLLLTLEIPDQQLYGLPGGGIDHGESVTTALRRELAEELNLTISDNQISTEPVGIRFSIFRYSDEPLSGMPYLNLYYQVDLEDDQIPVSGEKEFIWADSESLGKLNIVNTQIDDIPMFRSYMEAR
jgi:8-oxo-dGTP pyrophosphatase MutT (NUDIX family)